MPTDAVVGALIKVLPHIDDHECGSHALGVVADHLPAILRATLPHWSAEDKREVAERLVLEMAYQAGYDGPKGRYIGPVGDSILVELFVSNLMKALAPTSEETRDG